MNDKPHLSATQLESYVRCPEAYRRSYVEREKLPPGIALLKGKGFHKGAETNMRQKLETHVDLPADDIVAASVAAFETDLRSGYALDMGETRNHETVIGEAKDGLATMAELHAKEQAPDYQPVMVEEQIRIELPGPRDLLAVIDLADDADRVTDFKTGGKKKSQDEADGSVQLTVYAGAYKVATGKLPSEVRLDVAIQSKTKTYRDVVTSHREPADFQALANRINVVSAAIDAGLFPPTTAGAWWCSAKFCGYHATCPFVNPRRRAGAQND